MKLLALSSNGVRVALLLLGVALVMGSGCSARDIRRSPPRAVSEHQARTYVLEVTGYCHCGPCCGWRRDWRGRPVIAYGSRKGERKAVGVTASGSRVRPGTIAADTSIFPFGTIMYVPGYGYGMVEDRGGAIKGYKIDLYFRTHQQALDWGRTRREVKVWFP